MPRERVHRAKARLTGKGIVSLFLLVMVASASVAQLPTGTILGVVKDSTGAVVPGGTVTSRNADTGQTRSAVSGGDGSYRFAALPVGNYEIRAEHPGFRAEVRSGLTLTVSQEAVVNFTLELGAIEQTVAVTAEAPLVNTTSGSLGGLVDEQKIADLPLNGRNYINLALMQPGVIQSVNTNSVNSLSTYGVLYSSNGAPYRSNNYLLDGAIMSNLYGTSSAAVTTTTLGVEGIREYRVVTNSFSAEYGMVMGSQMLIVSKSGTNNLHGSLFEYLRNSVLDARNFFDYKTAATTGRLPSFKRNNFGGSFGGPIKKDKTFFFGTYEALRERKGITTVSNIIPSADKLDGGLVPQIAPVIKPLLTLYPDPNLPNNLFTYPFSQPDTENYGQMRVDQTFSNADSLFGRYTISDAQQTKTIAFPQFETILSSRSQFLTLSQNHIFSPSLLNTFRFSYSRTLLSLASPSGIIGPQYSFLPGKEIGIINIGGVTALGPNRNAPGLFVQNIFTWSDDLFYTRGRHSLKFGALINHFQNYINSGSIAQGSISFANLTTFLLAQPTSLIASTPGSITDRTYHYNTLGFYGQDDVRVTSKLTLNLGLRYEFSTQIREVRGHGAGIPDLLHDAVGTPGVPFINPSLKDISPRFGFAWDVRGDGKTAVRGGFGLLYDVDSWGSGLALNAGGSPPFSSQSSIQNPGPLVLPLFFPPSAVGKAPSVFNYHMRQPYMLQYNLTVDRQLPFSMGLSVAYAGSRGIDIARWEDGNPNVAQILPDGTQFWPADVPRTNPNWQNFPILTLMGIPGTTPCR